MDGSGTGYTARLTVNSTLAEFLDWCSHAFFYDLDFSEPLPANGRDLDYEVKRVEDARVELGQLRKMTLADARARERAERLQSNKQNEESNARRERQLKFIRELLGKVLAWKPPESCNSVRQFMIEQLQSEIKHTDYTWGTRKSQPAREWLAERLKWAQDSLERAEADLAEKREQQKRTQEFVRDICAEMAKIKARGL